MSAIRLGRLLLSFKYALKGIIHALREEQNMRVHFLAVVIVVILAIFFQVSLWEAALLTIVSALVIMAELINTALERVVDVIKPRMHPYAKSIKDMQAAMVLMASLAAAIVGLIIFLPKALELF